MNNLKIDIITKKRVTKRKERLSFKRLVLTVIPDHYNIIRVEKKRGASKQIRTQKKFLRFVTSNTTIKGLAYQI